MHKSSINIKIIFYYYYLKLCIINLKKRKLIKKGGMNMDLTTKDIIKKKILDAQENVRDYQMYSHKIDDKVVADLFGEFAENEAIQAKKLRNVLDKYDSY